MVGIGSGAVIGCCQKLRRVFLLLACFIDAVRGCSGKVPMQILYQRLHLWRLMKRLERRLFDRYCHTSVYDRRAQRKPVDPTNSMLYVCVSSWVKLGLQSPKGMNFLFSGSRQKAVGILNLTMDLVLLFRIPLSSGIPESGTSLRSLSPVKLGLDKMGNFCLLYHCGG